MDSQQSSCHISAHREVRWGQALCSLFKPRAVSIFVAVACQIADSARLPPPYGIQRHLYFDGKKGTRLISRVEENAKSSILIR